MLNPMHFSKYDKVLFRFGNNFYSFILPPNSAGCKYNV